MSLPPARVGSVAAPDDSRRAWRAAWIAAGLGSGAWMISVNPLVGGLFVSTGAGWIAMRRARKRRWAARWSEDLTEMFRRLGRGDLDGMEMILRRRERISTNAVGRAILAHYRGDLCWRRGDLDGALGSFLEHVRLMPRPVAGFEVGHWNARFAIANLQLELRQLTNAERSCARAFEVPVMPSTVMAHVGLETHHALVHDRPDELGDAPALASRVEVARTGKQGLVMLVLAWAYEALGDRSTADALAAEARAWLEARPDHWRTLYPRAWAALAPRAGLEP